MLFVSHIACGLDLAKSFLCCFTLHVVQNLWSILFLLFARGLYLVGIPLLLFYIAWAWTLQNPSLVVLTVHISCTSLLLFLHSTRLIPCITTIHCLAFFDCMWLTPCGNSYTTASFTAGFSRTSQNSAFAVLKLNVVYTLIAVCNFLELFYLNKMWVDHLPSTVSILSQK